MRPSLVGGAILAVATAVLVFLGETFNLDLQQMALLGASLGGALGLIGDRSLLERAGAFFVGFLLAWLGYALRAGFLPDATSGRVVAVLLVVGLCVVVAFVAADRLPLWAMLLGVASLVGAYEEIYTAAPSRFVEQSASAATTVLLAAAVGFLCTALVSTPRTSADATPKGTRRRTGPTAEADEPTTEDQAHLDEILAPKETQP